MFPYVITSKTVCPWMGPTAFRKHEQGMRLGVYAILLALTVSVGYGQRFPQETATPMAPIPSLDKTPAPETPLTTNSTVLRTNSMAVLDDKKRLARRIFAEDDHGYRIMLERIERDPERKETPAQVQEACAQLALALLWDDKVKHSVRATPLDDLPVRKLVNGHC